MQLIVLGKPIPTDVRVILLPDHRTGWPDQLWFRWKDDWVREEFCGKFPDGTPRPPWLDDQFWELWESEGPEAARDKSRYDLSEQEAILSKEKLNEPKR